MKDSDRYYAARGTDSPSGWRSPEAKASGKLARFTELNRQVTSWGGSVVSHVGANDVTVECLPGSIVPAKLERELGYTLKRLADGERMFCNAIVKIVDDGNPCRAPRINRYDGPCRVERYEFRFHD